ncbi:vWA domain-containing protein [Edaphobacillus lindanitolerans]|uniref:Mg-chelatase subunit ChlD n=1 Tax=Edaphobacillus lindanitolerans TaxID=550447 RepID=A0A1U7PPU8_9BACI|nr:hypothetical protein [Edaphobacillus lindanitolerans]SIT81258.1 Mg-chelatase subunit ChlD [Edaphobacillus lindanitolerans]
MKSFLPLLLAAVLLAGCSGGGPAADESNPPPQDSGTGDKGEERTPPASLPDGPAQAATPDELAALTAGTLTAEFPVEQEASTWSRREVPEEIHDAFLNEMQAVSAGKDDADAWFAAIAGTLATPAYGELVPWLVGFRPDFDEPLLPEPEERTAEDSRADIPDRAVILLDASSSMLLEADGRLKMDTAKSAVRSFGRTIGQKSDVSLYVYGHAGTQNRSDKELSCGTIDEVFPAGPYDEERFNKAVDGVKAAGWTPLAGAIRQAREDLAGTDGDITVYIVSDGAETCGGDPVGEADAFVADHPGRHVDIIGFQVDAEAESQLKSVAEAGNGRYLGADTLEEMTGGIAEMWLPSDLDLSLLVFQSPNGWASSTALHHISDKSSLTKRSVFTEHLRFLGAADLLLEEGLIGEDTRDELLAMADSRKDTHARLLDELAEEKRDAVTSEVERIDKKIDDYRTRMEKLKKEQGD